MILEGLIALLKAVLHVVNFAMLGLTPIKSIFRFVFPLPPKRKRVVIIGGSFAGLAAQRDLSDEFYVTVIDSKKFVEYTPGILRAFVEPSFLKEITCPMPSTRNKFVHGTVTAVNEGEVTVSCNNTTITISFDYLLVGTGSSYVAPIKCTNAETSVSQRQATWVEEAARLKEAASVLIVGAGPVGVELAGEIMTEYPQKKVTLVDGASKICAQFPDASISYMTQWLVDRGCQLELGVPIAGDYPDLRITNTGCELKDGRVLESDIVYRCLGLRANAGFMKEAFGGSMDRGGRLIVNESLQLQGHVNIFAMGDCMIRESELNGGMRDLKLGHTAELNAHLICKNLYLAEKGEVLLSYPDGVTGGIPTPIIYCVSLGKYHATLGMNWLVVNGFVSAVMKWLLEYTKMMAMQEQPLGVYFWKLSDYMSMLLARTVLKAETEQPKQR